MNLEKLNPWNWFKHEAENSQAQNQIPLTRERAEVSTSNGGANSLLRLHREMDQLFDDVFNAFGMLRLGSSNTSLPSTNNSAAFYSPQIDVSGDEKQYDIVLDVPGLSEGDLNIEVKGDILTISGRKEEKKESNDKHFYRVERRYGSFQRTLSLPEDANADDIIASLDSGVLKLTIPRQEIEKKDVRKIKISS